MDHDILGMVGRLMRACLLFAIDGRIGSSRLTILHAIHLLIPFAFTLSFLLILVLFFIFAFGFEILESKSAVDLLEILNAQQVKQIG